MKNILCKFSSTLGSFLQSFENISEYFSAFHCVNVLVHLNLCKTEQSIVLFSQQLIPKTRWLLLVVAVAAVFQKLNLLLVANTSCQEKLGVDLLEISTLQWTWQMERYCIAKKLLNLYSLISLFIEHVLAQVGQLQRVGRLTCPSELLTNRCMLFLTLFWNTSWFVP